MKIHIKNEATQDSAWFDCPVDPEAVKSKLGLNVEDGYYTITDSDLPFDIDPCTGIEEISRLCSLLEQEISPDIYPDIRAIIGLWFLDLEDFISHVQSEELFVFGDCYSMEDLAVSLVEQGALGSIPDEALPYMDTAAFARDLAEYGRFHVGTQGVYQYAPKTGGAE